MTCSTSMHCSRTTPHSLPRSTRCSVAELPHAARRWTCHRRGSAAQYGRCVSLLWFVPLAAALAACVALVRILRAVQAEAATTHRGHPAARSRAHRRTTRRRSSAPPGRRWLPQRASTLRVMGNVGGGEILVILLVALIFLGPEKLPEVARQLGKVMVEARKVSAGFQREMTDAMRMVDDAINAEATTPTAAAKPTPSPADRPAALDPDATLSRRLGHRRDLGHRPRPPSRPRPTRPSRSRTTMGRTSPTTVLLTPAGSGHRGRADRPQRRQHHRCLPIWPTAAIADQ